MERPIEKLKQLQENCDKERNELMNECDMLQGNINRMMVTHDHEELLTMFAYAHELPPPMISEMVSTILLV